MRSKIKEKKAKSSAETKKMETEDVPKPKEAELPANVELGSVEHYKELTKNSN